MNTLNVNAIENGGFYYPGMAEQVANLLEYDTDNLMPAYVKGENDLIINEDRFDAELTAWYCEKDGIIEVTPSLHRGGVIRLPRAIFEKYFVEMFTKES